MKNLIIIPAFNEQECIKDTVEMIKRDAPDFESLIHKKV